MNVKRGRPSVERAETPNSIELMRKYYIRRKSMKSKYTIAMMAESLDISQGALKAWFYRSIAPTKDAWQKFVSSGMLRELDVDVPIMEEAHVCPKCGIVHSRVCRPSFQERLSKTLPSSDVAGILAVFVAMKRRNG